MQKLVSLVSLLITIRYILYNFSFLLIIKISYYIDQCHLVFYSKFYTYLNVIRLLFVHVLLDRYTFIFTYVICIGTVY